MAPSEHRSSRLDLWAALLFAVGTLFSSSLAAVEKLPETGGFGAALDAAAEAGRHRDLALARQLLSPYVELDAAPESARARIYLGLLAHSSGNLVLAEKLLGQPGPPEWEDWRLTLVAECASARQDLAAARQALDQLVAIHPDSPLVAAALLRSAELAAEAGDLAALQGLRARADTVELSRQERQSFDELTWKVALARGDGAELRGVGRRLLVTAPLAAAKLRVVDILAARRENGSDWRLWLEPEELELRARALIEIKLPAGALTTLAAVSPEQRGFSWQLLEAQALTASERGAEALLRLSAVVGAEPRERAELEWERANAAAEAARRRTGRSLAADAEKRYRNLFREHLLAVARSSGAPDLARRAWAELATGFLEEGRTDEAVAALRQLLIRAPFDTTAARPLFELGWSAYEGKELERARRIWSDLVALYPTSHSARSARYWSARAGEQVGQKEAAKALYLELLATDTADFYARLAGLRLAGASVPPAPMEREAWPVDPRLERARSLSDLGLDALALREIALVGAQAEPRAAAALVGVVRARTGERRSSLAALRIAFPDLGTALQRRVPHEALALFYPVDFRPAIARAALSESLSPALVFGMVHQESAFDPSALSRSGARGLMQVMPATGKEVARWLRLPFSTARLSEPDYSLQLGTRYFHQMLNQFDGNVELALAGYNAGPGRISRLWHAAGPKPELDRFLEGLVLTESRNYVKRIVALAESYRSLYPDLG